MRDRHDTSPPRVAYFIDGVLIPERDGASARFSRLPSAIARAGIDVFVFHAFRGWSDLDRISREPFSTFFFPPETYYNDLSLITALVQRERIDIVQFHDLETVLKIGVPLANATGVKVAFEAIYHSSTLAGQLGLPAAEVGALVALEHLVAGTTDLLVTLTEPDRARWVTLSGAPSDRVRVLPFGVESPLATSGHNWIARPSIVFLGNCYFEPNRRALRRILQEIWPPIRSHHGDATCLVIGQVPREWKAACTEAGITLVGEVPDPETYLRQSSIGLAPVFEGSGVRVKLIHYISAGLPAIAASMAAEGLDLPAITLSDSTSEYPGIVSKMLEDASRVRESIRDSQQRLADSFTWDRIALAAAHAYHWVITSPPQQRALHHSANVGVPMWLAETLRSGRFADGDIGPSTSYRYGVAAHGHIRMY